MNAVTTEKVPMPAKETDTQLLIILLSVISSISATLLIILVIVCIRCRLMRMSVSDHVYSEPSPALQAHYDYISSLETEKPRPQLADEYFEVADALPFDLRDTPASPAYAEVEQFIDFKKGQWSSLDSSEWADCQSRGSNSNIAGDGQGQGKSTDADDRKHKSTGTGSAKGAVEKLKSDRFNRSPKNKRLARGKNSSEPKVFIVNLENGRQESNSVCDDSSAYEQIEIHPNGERNKVVFVDPKYHSKTNPADRQDNRRNHNRRIIPTSNDKQKSSPQLQSRVDQIKEGLLSKYNDKKDGTSKKKENGGNTSVASRNENESPVLNAPNKKKPYHIEENPSNKTTTDSTDERSGQQKPLLLKERLQTSGIVRNGIQKFEQN